MAILNKSFATPDQYWPCFLVTRRFNDIMLGINNPVLFYQCLGVYPCMVCC